MGMHFSISVFGAPACYTDVALPCYFALKTLGWKCCVRRSALTKGTANIIFGAHAIPPNINVPPNSIIYNFETVDSPFFSEQYIQRLKNVASVWDSDAHNARTVRQRLKIGTTYVFPGYVPEMTCLAQSEAPKLEMLFYGIKTERRSALINSMIETGLQPTWLHGFDSVRDTAIAKAEFVLNIHAVTPDAPLEISRLGFLWANEKAVLSEDCAKTGIPNGLEEACVYAPYEVLADMALKMHSSPSLREGIARRGNKAFKAKPLAAILERIVGRPIKAVPDNLIPTTMNVGSGGDFLPHCLNVDINPERRPDIVADLSIPLEADQVYHSERFGDIRLKPGTFCRIIASHVLEHIRNLQQMMTNFLELLEEGGELEIAVPYELSSSAWQDPTHVRVLNENSWIYYCRWYSYLGWRDYRFELEAQEFEMSDYGKQLQSKGYTSEELLRTPRAVSSQKVILRKRKTTKAEKERRILDTRVLYREEVAAWRL